MNWLLLLLFWCPKCWSSIGYGMVTLSGSMLLLGWRLSNRVDRIENRTGVVIDFDKVLAALPLPIPASSEGFVFAIFGVLLGLTLASAGKWAQRF
ncbi:hypothetical protein BSY239_690 [Hydrogenophaga sp. RAC07]|uniref:hypothetical protein n=1 Tax=Hydrogenophaga sp. RAC07 TaxID=1842537 RepID=UPI00083DF049|nr:hypothetical protein [Hydrogenophaga sp. RAC07]AOF87860.1 hypothetical protein BSY239_690 [Hydrogenophaga sp. RAC07]